ncbi:MAG TPA: bacteriohopanetetrol glucosamine biosynthesis glycosyltransferase HpnI [Caulobacteraceae bacterium]|nr:bacteriohopanetetrol glucosamine biosynthesis glycosyltransferase HpnI [Caulobacteraceae bacterium]
MASQGLFAAAALLAVIAGAGSVYWIAAGAVAARFLGRPADAPAAFPAVSVLRPMRGDQPGLSRALDSLAAIAWPAPLQFVFGFQDQTDPALPVVQAWKQSNTGLDVEIVVDERPHGANLKIANLINMYARARYAVVAVSDADIAVPAAYLTSIAAALEGAQVGAVSFYYRGEGVFGRWSGLSAMAISYNFLPNAIFGEAVGLAKPCFGSTIALSRDVLRAIGGFEAFGDRLADDYEIGRAVRSAGKRVVLPPMFVTHLCGEASLAELIAHELRWAVTIRTVDPAGHAGSLLTHPVALALIATALAGFAPWSLAVLASALAARLFAKGRIDSFAGASSGPAWLLPARDILSFCVWAASLAAGRIAWAGQSYAVDAAGRLRAPT